jgi:hypothetical protein
MSDGEKQGVRERIERVAKHAIDNGTPRREAFERARRAAVNHEHNQGRRDPNRNRR